MRTTLVLCLYKDTRVKNSNLSNQKVCTMNRLIVGLVANLINSERLEAHRSFNSSTDLILKKIKEIGRAGKIEHLSRSGISLIDAKICRMQIGEN